MILERYSSEITTNIWSEVNRFNCMLKAEIAYTKALIHVNYYKNNNKVWVKHGKYETEIKREIWAPYRNFFNYTITTEDLVAIQKLEAVTKHETLAFLTFLEQKFPEETKLLHFGLTSSDAIDTGLAIQLNQINFEIEAQYNKLVTVLKEKCKQYAKTPMYGRSHGMHAEVTTFGYILAGHLHEITRAVENLKVSATNLRVGKFSGPVGNYTNCFKEVEQEACSYLYLGSSSFTTQVIPRDRHAQFISSCAVFAGVIERLATTIRHLQRPEINEVAEGFSSGQKGSSSMPHKKNPILCENLCGLARLVRSTVQPALEDINLWHERDMTHSSVERVILPEATTLLCFMIERMTQILTNLVVYPENMLQKIYDNDNYASQSVLLTLVQNGFSRQDAYKIVQDASFNSKTNKTSFRRELILDNRINFDKALIQRCFEIQNIIDSCSVQIENFIK